MQRISDGDRKLLVLRQPDASMSSSHARLRRTGEEWRVSDETSKNGTFVGDERIVERLLCSGDILRTGSTLWLVCEEMPCAVAEQGQPVEISAETSTGFTTFNANLAAQFASLGKVARGKLTILLSGPTGSGKEVVASEIHRASGRPGPFVSVNCGAIPAGLVEATLFGSRKGAFSSATENRAGLVRTSDGGTLFLDEIGELPLAAQTALLRVLQEREVLAVGADTPTAVDLRVVAASHCDLEQMVADKRFREDLLARLSGHTMVLPALKDRPEDFGLLCARLLTGMEEVDPKRLRFTVEAANAMLRYEWPRNIRELAQAIARAVALCDAGIIDAAHLPDVVMAAPRQAAEKREEPTKTRLVELLQAHQGNLSAMARDMNTSRSQVRRLLERHGVEAQEFRAE